MGRVNEDTTNEQRYADIAISPEGDLYCTWYDWRFDTLVCEIHFSKSTDGGNSWSSPVRISDTSFTHDYVNGVDVDITCFDEQNIQCSWIDRRSGHYAVYYSMSSDGGLSWIPNIKVNDAGNLSPGVFSLCLDEQNNPCIVWTDDRLGIEHIYFDRGEFQTIEEVVSYSLMDHALLDIYPNPFKKTTDIVFSLGHPDMIENSSSYGTSSAERIELKIYDVAGCVVKNFSVSTAYSIVPTVVSWDGKDEKGNNVPSGIYFCEFKAGDNYKATKKLIKLK